MSGYISVGHVFEVSKEQSIIGYKRELKKLISVVYCSTDQTAVNPVGLLQFDTFFTNVPISVDSTICYFEGILKRHEFDNLEFQSVVENDVFNYLLSKHEFNKRFRINLERDKKEQNEKLFFQLFCLFNRFCDTKKVPMTMRYEALYFVLRKCGITAMKTDLSSFTFLSYVEYVYNHNIQDATTLVKMAYDEFCRDVLIENERPFCIRSNLEEPQIGTKRINLLMALGYFVFNV